MKCYRPVLRITWKEKKTNEYVLRKVMDILGERPERVEEIIKRRKLRYYGYKMRRGMMAKVLVEGRVEGDRRTGRPKRQWEDDLREWSEGWTMETLRRATENRQWWRQQVQE
eukprot:gene19771-21706_t